MESLITDLAFILLLGAVVTVLFKWLKQPVVLGYIVAGFLASPNFTPIPSVTTEANIDFWAELGIIVLLFSLGVEFSFKKLMNVGGSAIVTVIIIITGMMMSGFLVGHFLGFSSINCLFLGGMLSMSSTTIIIKAFTDMGLRQKKFASIVFGVLIVEDLFAVLLMVVLSSIAVNKSVEGSELLLSVSKLVFFLVIWFVVGVYVLPSVLNRVRVFLNNETLLVVSMGLCLGMAVFSVACGFSLALGAFVMGSILAGTSYAERIERVTMPVKDLFGSVFFISVGMMVQPTVVVEYWGPILLLSGVVIVGMIVFASFGLIVTGQSLKVAIQSGFSLTQIGEFAFIIASLGQSLGVLDSTIYPIVVAVSVITTFTTPYFIKMADPFYRLLDKLLPNRLHSLLDRFHKEAETQQGGSNTTRKVWGSLIKRYAWRIMLFSIIIIAISLVSSQYFTPWLVKVIPSVGKLVGVLITLAFIAPFLMALSLPVSKKGERELLAASGGNHGELPLVVMSVVRVLIGLGLVISFISSVYGLAVGIVAGIVFIVLILMVFSRQVMNGMRNIEAKFINNLNERELRRSGKNNSLVSDLHLAYMHVGCNAPFVGERLIDSGLQKDYGVNVVNIQRGQQFIPVPAGDARLFPGDVVGVVGTDAQLEALLPVMEHEEHSEGGADARDFELRSVSLSGTSPLLGKTIEQIDVRRRYQAFILAIERGGETITNVIKEPLEEGDRLWMVGSRGILDAIS